MVGRYAQRHRLATRLVEARYLAGLGLFLIATFGLFGVATAVDPHLMGGYLRLNGEWTIPAAFSGLLLMAGALAAATIGSTRWRGNERRPIWFAFAGVLAWMGIDEVLAIHERIESVTGIDWQLAYLPLIAFAAVSWILVLRRLGQMGRLLLVGGATGWLVSQLLELLQWQGDEKQAFYVAMMIPEELLEMCGSLFFLVALVAHLRSDSLAATRTGVRRR